MGRSARVPFTIKAKRDDVAGRVGEAESFFVDSLEQWRIKMGLEKMTLIGHSLGAYFSVVYALKYPTRVNRLVLLSPAGVPYDPSNMPSREEADRQGDESSESLTKAMADEIRADQQKVDKTHDSRTRKLLTYLFEEGWSPFQIVRSTMFWSPMLIGKVCCSHLVADYPLTWIQYSSRRFSGLSEEDTRDLHDYIMNITLAKGSGEYCICT
jgi:cardiolipin-specific phospholipase